MGRWQVHRSDGNAADIYETLEARGASVTKSGRPTDAIIGYRGATALVEVKTATGKLRTSQRTFLQGFRGLWAILRTPEDGAVLLNAMACRYPIPMALQRLDPLPKVRRAGSPQAGTRER